MHARETFRKVFVGPESAGTDWQVCTCCAVKTLSSRGLIFAQSLFVLFTATTAISDQSV